MKKALIFSRVFLVSALFFALGFFGGGIQSVEAEGTAQLVGVGHSNSVCTGPVAPDGGSYFQREDAPINDPNVSGDQAVGVVDQALPYPSAYPNACFQLEIFETQPNGNRNTSGGSYVPYSAESGTWHVGSGVASITPSPGVTAGGKVQRHAYGSAAATFEYQSCSAYTPPQCTNTGRQIYTDWQPGLSCSGGTLLQKETGSYNYTNTASPVSGNPLSQGEAASLAKSLNASCASLTVIENWKRGEPISRSVTFVAYGSGSKPVALKNVQKTKHFALYTIPEKICTPASGTCSAVSGPSATITANPPTIKKGETSKLSWSSANAISCTGTGFSTLGDVLGKRDVSPSVTTTYPLVCYGQNTSTGAGTWQYRGQDISDMHAVFRGGTATVDANSAYRGVPDCPVSNPAGNACSGSGACKVNTVNGFIVNSDIYSCIASGSASSIQSKANTSVTVFVDTDTEPIKKPQCSDGIDNDGDGKIDAADPECSGGGGGAGGAGGAGTSEFPSASLATQCSDGIDNNNVNGVDLDDPACSSSGDNDEGIPPPANLSLSVNRWLVLSGSSVVLTWNAENVKPGSCVLSGTNGDSWSSASGVQPSSPLNAETTFTLSCTDYNGEPVSQSVKVRLIPRYKEF